MSDGRRLGIAPSLLVVLAAFVAGQIPLLLATATTEHPDPPIIMDPIDPTIVETWGRYDTWLYLEVARSGPSLYHCSPEYWPATEWCGNSGWLPLYPALIRAVTTVSPLEVEQAGAVLARAAFAGELALIWFGVFRRRASVASVLALLLAATSAGVIWQVAIFPMSLTVLLATASLVLLARDRWVLAGLAAGLAATAHTMGVVAIGIGGLCILVDLARSDRRRADLRAATDQVLRYTLPAVACYVAMLAWYQWTVGEWAAPFMSQRKYGHSVQNPLAVLVDRAGSVLDPPSGLDPWQYVQTVLVAVVAVAVVTVGVVRWPRLERVERYLVVATVALWIVPLSYGGDLASYYRLESLTLPAMALTRQLPRPAQGLLYVAFAVTSYHVAQGFYTGVLI